MTKHTPTPWEYVPGTEHHGPYVTSEFGNTVADLYTMTLPGERSVVNGGPSKPVPFLHEMADPNAEFIVRAVNSHDALVAIAEEVVLLGPGKCSLGKQFVENAMAALASARMAKE